MLLDAQGLLRKQSIVYGDDLEEALAAAHALTQMSEDDQEEAQTRRKLEPDNRAPMLE